MNQWTASLRRATRTPRLESMPSSGSAADEMRFWEEAENVLSQAEARLTSPPCAATLELLRRAKRFHATQPLDAELAALRAALERARSYRGLTRGFPADGVAGATSLAELAAAVRAVFEHMKKVRKATQYPLARYVRLGEAVSRDMVARARALLAQAPLLAMPYEDFVAQVEQPFNALLEAWKQEFSVFGMFLSELRNRQDRQERTVAIYSDEHHVELAERVAALAAFRRQHDELQRVVRDSLGAALLGDVQAAYAEAQLRSGMDLLSAEAMRDMLAAYGARIDRVEQRVVALLRASLSTAHSAADMFAFFSQYNALFVRPRIRNAIAEYQDVLLGQVRADIEELGARLRSGYASSPECLLDSLHDTPPVAGAVVWARQLQYQLEGLMKRLEDVLGPGWTANMDGKKLKQEGDALREKLDTEPLFREWTEQTKLALETSSTGSDHRVSGFVLAVNRRGKDHVLSVAFDERLIVLFKEVRNLGWLGFRVLFSITLLSSSVRQVYPHVVTLRQHVRIYNGCCSRAEAMPQVRLLVAAAHRACQTVVAGAVRLKWTALSKLPPLVASLGAAVTTFKAALAQASEASEAVEDALAALQKCPYTAVDLSRHVAAVQKQCDALDLAGLSNLQAWTRELQQRVEQVLGERLAQALDAFAASLESSSDAAGFPPLEECSFAIVVRNGSMVLEPPLAEARAQLLRQLSARMHTVVRLAPLQAGRYNLDATATAASAADLSHLLSRVPTATLCRAYRLVEEKMKLSSDHVQQWLRYQGLWDMDHQTVYAKVGSDQTQWQQLLQQIKSSRSLFEGTGSTDKEAVSLWPIRVDTSTVRASVGNKYDFWHRDILHEFGARVGRETVAFFEQVSKLRQEFEGRSVAHDSAEGAVELVIHLQEVQRQLPVWQAQMAVTAQSHDTLRKHRWTLPAEWMPIEMVEAEWSAFTELVKRRQQALALRIPELTQDILKETLAAEQAVTQLKREWEGDGGRPKGSQSSETALQGLAAFHLRAKQLQDRWVRLQSARRALETSTDSVGAGSGSGGADENATLKAILDECAELKEVWLQLGNVWKRLRETGSQAWGGVIPRRVRTALDERLQELRGLPARVKQYEAFDRLQATIKTLLECNGIITDLKSEALRDRHWNELRKRLRAKWVWGSGDLTLQDIWDSDVKNNAPVFKDIITQAQGEMALEVFLQQVREHWESTNLDLINYRGKCSLIRGWDELFQKLTDHINSLAAMRISPYFRVFEAECTSWDEKLNKLFALFDIWIDVQRRWVYLEGIFSGSAEIAQLLPIETQRFRSVNGEFLALMRKAVAQPNVLVVGGQEGAQRGLEKLLDVLCKIQKALGEYLEKQRSAFPRFYFVGDDDLLEIIGAGKDVSKIQKHFKKMFAGLASVQLTAGVAPEEAKIEAMQSAEGETLPLPEPFATKELKIHEWLTRLELQSRLALCHAVEKALAGLRTLWPAGVAGAPDKTGFTAWLNQHVAQACLLALQIVFTQDMEQLQPAAVLVRLDACLGLLAENVLGDLAAILRRKHEHAIGELVHQRDVARRQSGSSAGSFGWLSEMRFYWDVGVKEGPLGRLTVRMANATLAYGWEYLGVGERLVQTPLTDRCYLTLTQALHERFGGSPAGPAGTGKTETVKALGGALGRFTLVFCCDESFDFQAMGRIFVGLCETGSWGCFDEFNRLEERILSAVSQQIQLIQEGLRVSADKVELNGRQVALGQGTGVFITMNPGYAGRVELPDNLKQLFRPIAMVKPDLVLIAQVMLFGQGFGSAERLAHKVVPLFDLMREQLSHQSHYDWGLRALKTVLVGAGLLKRATPASANISEERILLQSIWEAVAPKLLHDDLVLFGSLLSDVFPGCDRPGSGSDALSELIKAVCAEEHLVHSDAFALKMMQVQQTVLLRHGVMLVGPSGSGKSSALRVLSEALSRHSQLAHVLYTLDAKAMHKDQLYGNLESTTREWTDGLFTRILRKIIENERGESGKVHWIVFDGDVDPEWVENLNSLLDDNKLLTLPNGERLALPDNVRILFEVDSLRYATQATVSRCGMVWFSDAVVTPAMTAARYLARLAALSLDATEAAVQRQSTPEQKSLPNSVVPPGLALQRECHAVLAPLFGTIEEEGPILRVLREAVTWSHVMEVSLAQLLNTLTTLINGTVQQMQQRNAARPDLPLSAEQVRSHMRRSLCLHMQWAFGGSLLTHDARVKLEAQIGASMGAGGEEMPQPLEEHFSHLEDSCWRPWAERVPAVEIETHQVASPDVVIPTVDTLRHGDLIATLLSQRAPLILCGPPGSGKTMTLFATLQALPDAEVVTLNFSSATSPELLLNTFAQHCEYKVTPKGPVLRPLAPGKWLVLFCDEINLPAPDKYGTQRVITFLRQLTEKAGFWRASDQQWVHLERIQFVGACNPPSDPGRVPLPGRFLRFAPVILVGFPNRASLQAIYGTMTRALLKLAPELRAQADPLTQAMLDVYTQCQKRFTPDMHAHYIFSPRELSRWVRSLHSAFTINTSGTADVGMMTVDSLVRLWLHEGLRLFQDRLVEPEERHWLDAAIDRVATERFGPGLQDAAAVLRRPVLYCSWTSNRYIPVERGELREYVRQRLKVFYEEELDVPLVLFNEVLDHILRIDRVFRQPQGHALLIGVSGGGKTVLSRFVAWLNGLTVFTIKVNSRYSAADFCADLRKVMIQAGVHDEKMCFIFDESNVLDSNFLELMNTLLASGDVPGLFEGDDLTQLLAACKDASSKRGVAVDADGLYAWFIGQVRTNLHVVFTMNPASPDFHNRSATSPALFNRCVLDWFGDWSETALFQVAQDFTKMLDLDGEPGFMLPNFAPKRLFALMEEVNGHSDIPQVPSHRDAALYSLVHMHSSVRKANARLQRQTGRQNYLTPRHFLDLIAQVVSLVQEKRGELEEQQLHLNVGVRKLQETEAEVSRLKAELGAKKVELELKNKQANEKLLQMVGDQQEAEKKRQESVELQGRLRIQEGEIAGKRSIAEKELARAEPAVEEARKAVSSIQKAHLDEIRALRKPPAMIQRVLEAVCVMLGHGKLDWDRLRKIMMDQAFIPQIVGFDSKTISKEARLELVESYTSDTEGFNFEKANRASKACGPLVMWLIAQLEFSDIVNRVAPLREEVARLEEAAGTVQSQAAALAETVRLLEVKIATLKEEYAGLIRETEQIKGELDTVGRKVERSASLLDSLGAESKRWAGQTGQFAQLMRSVVGDCLLGAGFLSYIGPFDQQQRSSLLRDWGLALEALGVTYTTTYTSPADYLCVASQRLEWRNHHLPPDDLCLENAVMLTRFNRYPLVIDPSGQATAFLMSMLAPRKVLKTSFLDASFQKNLESALRFGCPIVVEDVESLDPVLNPILNKEVRKQGGRVLIRLGDQDIDFSPSFVVYLTTRDASARFTPDLCSRVTLVNFTVTRAGLAAQCLSQLMQAERPDVEARREAALKLQGETRVALRGKEQELLDCISGLSQSLLQDDQAVRKLESLKSDAAAMTRQAEASEGVMAEVRATQAQFQEPAEHCAALFFAVDGLQLVHFLYQVSLHHFQACYALALSSGGSAGIEDRLARLLYNRISRGLLEIHRPALAFRLALARLQPPQQEVDYLLGTEHVLPAAAAGAAASSLAEWKSVLGARDSEQLEQEVWKLVHQQLGWGESEGDGASLATMTQGEQLVLLVGTRGNDPGPLVDDLAASTMPKPLLYQRIAIGSAEGFVAADRALVTMTKQGGWLLLRNVHLAPAWLVSLEKRLHAARPLHPGFRLFLAADAHPGLPTALLRACRVLVFETPPGLRSAVLQNLRVCAPPRAPAERSLMRYLVCHGHALLTERLRFVPLGWSKQIGFSNTDLQVALRTVDSWIDQQCPAGRPNVDPAALPWEPVRSLLCQVVYGGRIDNDQDQRLLESLWTSLLRAAAFSDTAMPDVAACRSPEQLEQWVLASLPETTPPEQLGLPALADRLLQKARCRDTLRALAALFAREQSDDGPADETEQDSDLQSNVGSHLARAGGLCRQWLAQLPAALSVPSSAAAANDQGALARFWRREVATASDLLRKVRERLAGVMAASEGASSLTNELRALLAHVRGGTLPGEWRAACSLPANSASLPVFVADLARRAAALAALPTQSAPCTVWLGGLLSPAALLTASRQHACAAHGWPLEQVRLRVSLAPEGAQAGGGDYWALTGMALHGATLDEKQALRACEHPARSLPALLLSWQLQPPAVDAAAVDAPFYVSEDRSALLFSAPLPVAGDPQGLVRAGLAIVAWSPPNSA